MKITSTPRSFTVEMTEEEIMHLQSLLESRSGYEDRDIGLDPDVTRAMNMDIREALDAE